MPAVAATSGRIVPLKELRPILNASSGCAPKVSAVPIFLNAVDKAIGISLNADAAFEMLPIHLTSLSAYIIELNVFAPSIPLIAETILFIPAIKPPLTATVLNKPSFSVSLSTTSSTLVRPSTKDFISSLWKRFCAIPTPVSFKALSLYSRDCLMVFISLSASPAECVMLSIALRAASKFLIVAATICPCRFPANVSRSCACCLSVSSSYISLISSSN